MVIVGTADASVCDGVDLQLAIGMKSAGRNIYILKEDVFCQSVLAKGWLRVVSDNLLNIRKSFKQIKKPGLVSGLFTITKC